MRRLPLRESSANLAQALKSRIATDAIVFGDEHPLAFACFGVFAEGVNGDDLVVEPAGRLSMPGVLVREDGSAVHVGSRDAKVARDAVPTNVSGSVFDLMETHFSDV